ncbi:MAG TPA: phospho-N-acetylmuramoyl-pentapeptide-transferase, partial [Massilibacterium sp.]|nr:phospho-N-acetylmuramoyl-pentapeptide-transferase [Massilibacterium sp.]
MTLITALFVAFIIAIIISPFFIPFLRKLKFGQSIRDEGPSWHQVKSGTPTMGGLVIILSIIVSTVAIGLMFDVMN